MLVDIIQIRHDVSTTYSRCITDQCQEDSANDVCEHMVDSESKTKGNNYHYYEKGEHDNEPEIEFEDALVADGHDLGNDIAPTATNESTESGPSHEHDSY
jgi:hypothetical protein